MIERPWVLPLFSLLYLVIAFFLPDDSQYRLILPFAAHMLFMIWVFLPKQF